jgi:hypothetical protein
LSLVAVLGPNSQRHSFHHTDRIMKLSVVAAAGLFAVALGTKPKKQCSKNCFNAIVSDTPASIGEAFCSSFLSLQPLEAATTTVTVVRDALVTTTNTKSETTTTTVTIIDATITTTTGTVSATTLTITMPPLAKRAQTSSDPSASILSACKTKSARISSICSYLLPAATALTSTVTVEQTSTSTTVVELTVRLPFPFPPPPRLGGVCDRGLTGAGQATAVETATNTVTVTEYAVATAQPTPFANGNFQAGSILPWTIGGSAPGVTNVHLLTNQAVCAANGACTDSDLLRFTPPPLGYVSILQTFDALPSTTYKVGLHMNAPANILPNALDIQVLYNQALLGTHEIISATMGSPYEAVSIWEFTTDSSGRGTLEVRVVRTGSVPAGYIYLDNITVVKKV